MGATVGACITRGGSDRNWVSPAVCQLSADTPPRSHGEPGQSHSLTHSGVDGTCRSHGEPGQPHSLTHSGVEGTCRSLNVACVNPPGDCTDQTGGRLVPPVMGVSGLTEKVEAPRRRWQRLSSASQALKPKAAALNDGAAAPRLSLSARSTVPPDSVRTQDSVQACRRPLGRAATMLARCEERVETGATEVYKLWGDDALAAGEVTLSPRSVMTEVLSEEDMAVTDWDLDMVNLDLSGTVLVLEQAPLQHSTPRVLTARTKLAAERA